MSEKGKPRRKPRMVVGEQLLSRYDRGYAKQRSQKLSKLKPPEFARAEVWRSHDATYGLKLHWAQVRECRSDMCAVQKYEVCVDCDITGGTRNGDGGTLKMAPHTCGLESDRCTAIRGVQLGGTVTFAVRGLTPSEEYTKWSKWHRYMIPQKPSVGLIEPIAVEGLVMANSHSEL